MMVTAQNMYAEPAHEVLETYGAFVEGTGDEAIAVLSAAPLSGIARNALVSSFRTLGYGEAPASCSFLLVGELGALDVRTIVEGLDPLHLILCDKPSCDLIAQGYRQPISLDSADHIMGRTVVSFGNFEQLLETPEAKQKAWALLKKLPKMN